MNAVSLRDALAGVKVVDFTQMAAGPVCTMLLADMGAEVVKVEPPSGDLARALGPAWIGDDSALFHAFNRNKDGIAVDLKTPEGLAIARRLVAAADVVVESMRPGVMARLGLGPAALTAAHPRLVYCSISAYGQTGPYAARAGVDGIVQADSGLMSLLGTPGAPPCKVQAPIVDIMTGYVAALGVVAALQQRERTGRGAHLDANLMNSALALQQASIAAYFADGVLPQPLGSAAPYAAPNEAFETADGWIMVAAYHGARWPRLCGVLGLAHLAADERFATSPARVANREAMVRELSEVTRTRPTAHWLGALLEADILCAPVAGYDRVAGHAQVTANGMLVRTDHALHGTIRGPGFPINSAASNALPHRAAPQRGEHTQRVLQRLGFAADEVERWAKSGVVQCASAHLLPLPLAGEGWGEGTQAGSGSPRKNS